MRTTQDRGNPANAQITNARLDSKEVTAAQQNALALNQALACLDDNSKLISHLKGDVPPRFSHTASIDTCYTIDTFTINNLIMLFHLSYLTALKLQGAEAANFLQGQLTADIRQVTETHYQPAALCNLQGRITSLMEVFQWRDALYLILPETLAEKVTRVLAKPAQFSRVQLSQEKELCLMGYWHEEEQTLPFPCPNLPYTCLATEDYVIGCIQPPFYLLLMTRSFAATLSANENTEAWHEAKLRRGEIEIYPNTSEQFLPHRLNLQETPYLSFNKGCYRGQEIIARTHYRATLKHHLVQYQVDSKEPLTPGMQIEDTDGQSLGELVDCCKIDENQYLISASLLLEHPNLVRFGSHQDTVMLQSLGLY